MTRKRCPEIFQGRNSPIYTPLPPCQNSFHLEDSVKLLFIAFCLLTLIACSRSDQDAGKKIVNVPVSDDVNSLDPARAYDSISSSIVALSAESLFQYTYTKVPLELEPLLAEAMPAVSKDQLTYTIKIKKGVRWQKDPAFPEGTRELKAQDFLYGWKRLLIPVIQSPGTWMFEGKVVGWDDYKKKLLDNKDKLEEMLQADVEGLKALDEHTIQIKLLKPYPQLPFVLAMGFGAPVAKEVTQKYGHENMATRLVGTGPYMLKEYTRGSKVVMVKNPEFRGELYPSHGDDQAKEMGLLAAAGRSMPFLDAIIFHIIKEDQPRWLQFQKGNLDLSGIPKDSFDQAVENGALKPALKAKGIEMYKGENATLSYLSFNMKDSVVGGKNTLLRQAISKAINRDEYIQKFLNGRGVKATSIVPRVVAGNTGRKELPNDYDPEGAKLLLAKAGFPGGKGLPVIRYDLGSSSTTARQTAEYFQKSLEAIGVKTEIIVNTFPAYLKKQADGNLQFFARNWVGDFPDAENFYFLFYSKNAPPGPNTTIYNNPAYDRLYEKVAAMPHSPARLALQKQAEEVIFGDAAIALLNYPLAFSPYFGWLKNYRPNGLIWNQYKYLDVDTENRVKGKKSL